MKSLILSLLCALALLPAPQSDVIRWDKTVHDFGDISAADGPVSCSFTLTNTGTEPVAVFEVVSSCGCTDVKWTREPIQPGQSGTISATYKNEDGPMAFDKTLTVYVSGVKRPVILRLRGVVHAQKKSLSQLFGAQKLGAFGIKERSLKAGTVRQGLCVSESVTVANLGDKPLSVSFPDLPTPLSISVTPNPIPAQSKATLSFTVKAVPGEYGRQEYSATPWLNGRKADGTIGITAWTQENFASLDEQGKKSAPLPVFETSTCSFGSVRAGEKLELSFTCANRGKQPFHVFQADSESPALRAVELPDVAPGGKGTLRFTLDTSALPAGETVIMLSLTTNAPLRPLVNLFVAGIIQ